MAHMKAENLRHCFGEGIVMDDKANNTNDHLANERTYLAWVRTSVGIMALGFVVVKFSLFVKQLSIILGKDKELHEKGYSAIIGILLVLVGAVTIIMGFWRYKKTQRQISSGKYAESSVTMFVMTSILFLMSVLMIVYLVYSV